MEQKQADSLIMLNSSKLSPEYIETIREQLVNCDYAQAAMLFGQLHDTTIVLVISVILGEFGIDRFMIGDIGIGIGKLCVTVFTCGVLSWVWWLIDLFLITDATRKKNSEKVMCMLGCY
jgi:TM2 domain-containing membrane protein YozV